MKRITKKIFIVLVAVAFVATGCKKESEYKTVTLGAKIAPGNSKVHIDGYTPKWNGGDVVNVNGNPITVSNVNGASAELHDVTESDDGYYAYYPADQVQENGFSNGVFTVTLPSVQEYEETTDANSQTVQLVKAPMGAKTNGGSLTFHNLCSLLKVTVTAGETLKIREIKVTAGTTNLSGSTSITLSGDATDALPAPATGSKSVTLSFGNTGKELTSGSYDFYIYLPAFTSQEVSVEVYNIDANNLGVKKKTFDNISVSANTINTVGTGSLTASSFTTIGAINTRFTVSSTKQVYFSKGNLQYNTGTGQFSFMDPQYSTVETDGQNVGTNYADQNIVSLFGWGAWLGNNPSNTSVSGYSWEGDEPITGWRTLSKNEWDSLLTKRAASTVNGTANARYAKAYLFGTTHGLIIFPDSYTHPAGVSTALTGINDYGSTSWDANQFTTAEWAQMEAAGCVFLPVAGTRFGKGVSNVGYYGYYWSSTPNDGSSAFYVSFDGSYLAAGNINERGSGMSVRLVQDY